MKKIRVMTSSCNTDLEKKVNEFIEDKTVTDIQYQYSGGSGMFDWHSVMIVYEE